MTIQTLDGDRVAVSPEQARQMARDAMAEYDAQYRAGGEPVYPQWAADILKSPIATFEKPAEKSTKESGDNRHE